MSHLTYGKQVNRFYCADSSIPYGFNFSTLVKILLLRAASLIAESYNTVIQLVTNQGRRWLSVVPKLASSLWINGS